MIRGSVDDVGIANLVMAQATCRVTWRSEAMSNRSGYPWFPCPDTTEVMTVLQGVGSTLPGLQLTSSNDKSWWCPSPNTTGKKVCLSCCLTLLKNVGVPRIKQRVRKERLQISFEAVVKWLQYGKKIMPLPQCYCSALQYTGKRDLPVEERGCWN